MEVKALLNETEILLRVAKGDESAFSELFLHYRKRIFSVAKNLCHSDEMAEEITQDVFMKVWYNRADLGTIRSFADWLFIIARNEIYSALAYQNRRTLNPDDLERYLPGSMWAADARVTSKEYEKLVHQALDELTPSQREVYKLVYLSGFKREEAAQQLGIAFNTVKVHLRLANKVVRRYLRAHLPLAILVLLFQSGK